MIRIAEIFRSIQGESGFIGFPCTFVRVAGCNLDCTYCDTRYAQKKGKAMSIRAISNEVAGKGCTLVEITGGEPLLQKDVPALCEKLLFNKATVLVETNGTCDISVLPSACHRIVDIKCPGAGMGECFYMPNLHNIRAIDEIKFVVFDRHDFTWARRFIQRHNLLSICEITISPCHGEVSPETVAEWIFESTMHVRLGIQLHKYLNMR